MAEEESQSATNGLLELAGHFHGTARAEIIQRIGYRDATLFLFLAGSATLFGLALSDALRNVLYLVPLLGLGAAQVYSQHSLVIGALGRYLGLESDEWLRKNFPNREIPVQWDNSNSLLDMPGAGYMRPVYLSGLYLIVGPQAVAVAVLAWPLVNGLISGSAFKPGLQWIGVAVGLLAILASFLSITSAFRARKAYSKELRKHAKVRGRRVGENKDQDLARDRQIPEQVTTENLESGSR